MEQDRDHSAAELEQFVRELDGIEGEGNCRIIRESGPLFDATRLRFPPYLGGINWRKAALIESSEPLPDETEGGLISRVAGHWTTFLSHSGTEGTDRVYLMSDDYFEPALDCLANAVPRVLESWLRLPHAVLISTLDYGYCLHVAFSRSIYVGKAR